MPKPKPFFAGYRPQFYFRTTDDGTLTDTKIVLPPTEEAQTDEAKEKGSTR